MLIRHIVTVFIKSRIPFPKQREDRIEHCRQRQPRMQTTTRVFLFLNRHKVWKESNDPLPLACRVTDQGQPLLTHDLCRHMGSASHHIESCHRLPLQVA